MDKEAGSQLPGGDLQSTWDQEGQIQRSEKGVWGDRFKSQLLISLAGEPELSHDLSVLGSEV